MNVSRDFFISTFLILPKCDLMKSCYCFESLLQMQLMFGKLIADIARFMLTTDCLLKLTTTLNNDSKCWSESVYNFKSFDYTFWFNYNGVSEIYHSYISASFYIKILWIDFIFLCLYVSGFVRVFLSARVKFAYIAQSKYQ